MIRNGCIALFTSFIIHCSLVSITASDQPEKNLTPQIKSILYPGWGQCEEGKWGRGTIFLSLETISIGVAAYYGRQGSRYYDRYKEAETPDEASLYREKTISHDKKRNVAIVSAAAIWAFNIFDIFFWDNGTKEQPDRGLSNLQGAWFPALTIGGNPEGLIVTLSFFL